MGLHQRPTPKSDKESGEVYDIAHMHFHFEPPLLRSSTVRKFLVGYVLDSIMAGVHKADWVRQL